MGVGCPCLGENLLMEVLNGGAFLNFWGPMDPVGLPISWLLMRIGGTEGPIPVRTLVVALGDTPTVFISIGISRLATFQFATEGFLKTRAALGTAPATIWCMCDAIYIGNNQQTFKERMDGHFSDLQNPLKNGQKLDSFASHFIQHFNNTTSLTDLRKFMTFKVVKQINPVGAMKTFTKPNCNLSIQECLTILKKLRDKHVTVVNKNSDIYGACRHKTTFRRFFLSTDDPVFNGWKG